MALEILLRTLLIYLVVLALIRLMGKREIGQLSAFDLVVAIMIAEVAVFPMEDLETPLYVSLIPVFTLVGAEIFFSFLCLKNSTIRRMINGSPTVIVFRGKIMEKEMRKLRYSVNDLLEQLREKEVLDLADVEYAILENSGELSVVLKPDKKPLTPADLNLQVPWEEPPVPLIFDGRVNYRNLKYLGWNEDYLSGRLQREFGLEITEVLYASRNPGGDLYVSEKASARYKENRWRDVKA